MKANQLEGAGTTFGQVIGRNPQVILAYARMSVIEHRMGRTAGARHNLKAAHFIVSSSMYGLNAAGTVGLEDGREEEAFHYFQQAFNLLNNKTCSVSHYYAPTYGISSRQIWFPSSAEEDLQ